MPGVGEMYVEVRPDTTGFVLRLKTDLDRAADTASRSFSQRMASSLDSTGRKLTRNVTLPIVAAGGASIYFAAQFETAMSRMVGLAGVPAKEVDALRAKVLDLAGKTARSPQELAEALYFITSSGQSGAQALETLRISARAAASGLGETQTVADAVTSVMAAYGAENITAARTTDILTASVKYGKAEADELAGGIGNLAPLAAQLGVGFEQLGAAVAAMTMVGVDTDTAFTNMSAIFSGLLKVTPQAADELEKVGLNAAGLRDTIKEPGGLLIAMRQIDDAFGGNEEAMARVFPNIRALRGVMALLAQNGEQVDEVFQGVAKSTGDADKAFKTATETSAFKFQQGLAKLQRTAIEVGNDLLPIAGKVVDVVGEMADAFNDLPDWGQNLIIGGAAAAATIGPIMRLTSGVITLGSGLVHAGQVAAPALGAALSALPAAFGPVGIAAAGIITALAIAFDASPVNEFEVAVKGAMARIRDEILRTGQVNSLGTAQWLQDELKRKGALQETYRVLSDAGVTFQQFYDALLTSSDGTGQWANQLGLTQEQAYRLIGAVGGLDVALLKAQSSVLAEAQATGNLAAIQGVWNQSMSAATSEVENLTAANGGALPPLTQLKDTFSLSADAAQAHANAVVAQTGNAADATAVFAAYKASLSDQLVTLGYTREEADLYAASLLGIPDSVHTDITADDSQAVAVFQGVDAWLAYLNGRKVTVQIAAEAVGAAAGALVPGAQHGGAVGGATWVGEAGPELALFPRGSRVITAQDSAAFVRHVESLNKARTVGIAAAPVPGGEVVGGEDLRRAARDLSAAAGRLIAAASTPGGFANGSGQNGIT